jgi:hypothetical protein
MADEIDGAEPVTHAIEPDAGAPHHAGMEHDEHGLAGDVLHDGVDTGAGALASSPEPPAVDHDDGIAPAAAPTLHGDPEAAVEWLQAQAGDGLCAVASVGMVASRMFGAHVDQASLEAAAERDGLLDDARDGLTVEQTAELLDRLGVPSSVHHGTLDDLRQYLSDGRGLIVAVDADELRLEDDAVDGGDGANHAIVVTAIDDARSVAIVDDPGRVDGGALEVPLERILDAWADADNAMVVTDHGDAGTDRGAAVERIVLEPSQDDEGGDDGGPDVVAIGGYVLLPVSIGWSALRRRWTGV